MIKVVKNKIIKTRIGKIYKCLDSKSKNFKKFGELYFNHLKKSNKKIDWILHKRSTCIIKVISGKVRFMYKIKSGNIRSIDVNFANNYSIVIPPKTWFRFQSRSPKSIFMNLINNIHNPKETLRSKE